MTPPPSRSISIDARTVTGAFTGIGRYTLELLRPLSPLLANWRVIVHATDEGEPLIRAATGGSAQIRVTHPIPRHPQSDLWLHATLPRWLARERIDIHFSCANYLPAFKGGARHVVTIHDLISFRHPETDPWRFATFLCAMTRLSVSRADRIIAVSSFTAHELETILDAPSARLRVVHNGLTRSFATRTPAGGQAPAESQAGLVAELGGPFILSVGARIPRKNFARLVEATARVRAMGLPHALVIAGPPGLADGSIHDAIRRSGMEGLAHLIDYPDDAALRRLMEAADLFAYPSIYEGFGLPVLEAMACGRPAVASQTSSCPEVGGQAVLYFDPTDVAAMARTIAMGLTDTEWRAKAVVEGHARAAHFTWEAAAERTMAVLQELVE